MMNIVWTTTFCLLLSLSAKSIAEDQQLMVCKPLSSVFETRPLTNATKQECQPSRPGKQGPRGLRGPPGPIGAPGKAANQSQEIKILKMEIRNLKEKMQCMDGVLVGNTCYKLPYQVGIGVNYETARSICAFQGMGLAEIPTEEVYDVVYDYAQDNWYISIGREDVSWVQLWLGSLYDGRGNVILTNGQQGFVRWFRTYPVSTAGHNRILLEVAIRPERLDYGIFNRNPQHVGATAPLCQFEIE